MPVMRMLFFIENTFEREKYNRMIGRLAANQWVFKNGATLAHTAAKFSRKTTWPAPGTMLSWQFGIILYALMTVGKGAFRSSSPATKSTGQRIEPNNSLLAVMAL